MFDPAFEIVAALAIATLGWMLWRSVGRRRRVVVLGELMARAERAEQNRLARGNNPPSPLPANLSYDSWLGDLDLSDPVELPLDRELTALCQRFATSDPPTRLQLRDAASMDDFYTLPPTAGGQQFSPCETARQSVSVMGYRLLQ